MTLFEEFWQAFPRKRRVMKPTAQRKFERLPPLFQEGAVKDVVARSLHDAQWLKDNGDFVPMPTTYLNNQRWLDEWEYVDKAPVDYTKLNDRELLREAEQANMRTTGKTRYQLIDELSTR